MVSAITLSGRTCGSEVYRVPHRHGRYQVANFERVVREGEHWKGKRGIISLYLNREILQHFEKHGRTYFDRNRQNISLRLHGPPEVNAQNHFVYTTSNHCCAILATHQVE